MTDSVVDCKAEVKQATKYVKETENVAEKYSALTVSKNSSDVNMNVGEMPSAAFTAVPTLKSVKKVRDAAPEAMLTRRGPQSAQAENVLSCTVLGATSSFLSFYPETVTDSVIMDVMLQQQQPPLCGHHPTQGSLQINTYLPYKVVIFRQSISGNEATKDFTVSVV